MLATPTKTTTTTKTTAAPAAKPQIAPAIAPLPQPTSFRADAFTPALPKPLLNLLGGVGPVQGPPLQGTRTQINDYASLLRALNGGTLQNADVNVSLDLSILKHYRDPSHPTETYSQFVTRVRADPSLQSEAAANRDLLDAMAANPGVNWNGLFEGQDLSGTTFRGPVEYANFYRASGTNVTFTGPISEGWFGDADFSQPRFLGGVTGSNFTGATLTGAQFTGNVERNAFNGSNLMNADFICVSRGDGNDFQFARLDNAFFGMSTNWGSSSFVGAVTTGASNVPAAAATLPALDLGGAVQLLGGEQRVRDLAANGQLLPELMRLGPPYSDAVQAMLPESWRSYLADGLGDGGSIKAEVYNAVDGRYSGRVPGFVPTLANLHDNTTDPRAAVMIDQKLAEIMLTPGMRLDDPMGLQGSASGLSLSDWTNHVNNTEVGWTGHPGTSDATPALSELTVPRSTLQQLYAEMERQGYGAEAEALRQQLDNFDSFKLGDLLASPDYPHAVEILYTMYGG
jgi:uncharacterized protein YjbI with pentapeptide repeats